jgi:hypothetical protein
MTPTIFRAVGQGFMRGATLGATTTNDLASLRTRSDAGPGRKPNVRTALNSQGSGLGTYGLEGQWCGPAACPMGR